MRRGGGEGGGEPLREGGGAERGWESRLVGGCFCTTHHPDTTRSVDYPGHLWGIG